MIDFLFPPPIGTLLHLDEQTYELRSSEPYERLDGTPSSLLIWETLCPKCGGPFEVTTGLKAKHIARRCKNCRSSTRPVKGRRGRRVNTRIETP